MISFRSTHYRSERKRRKSRRRANATASSSVKLDGVLEVVGPQGQRRADVLHSRIGRDLESSPGAGGSVTESTSSSALSQVLPSRITLFSCLVVSIGVVASTLFLGFGISGSVREQEVQFRLRATETVNSIEEAWKDYEVASLWLHQACHLNNISRLEFENLYYYLLNGGLDIKAAQWVPNVTHSQRAAIEANSAVYFENQFPGEEYQGFTGYEPDDSGPSGISIQPRSEQDFYFPIDLVQPIQTNMETFDLDLYSSERHRVAIDMAFSSWKPAVSSRMPKLEILDGTETYSVTLIHPGIPLPSIPDARPRDVAALDIQMASLLKHAAVQIIDSISVFVYDAVGSGSDTQYIFLGAVELYREDLGERTTVHLPEVDIHDVTNTPFHILEQTVSISSSNWTIVVVALEETFQPNITFIVLAGKFILIACLCLALWIFTSMRRARFINEMKNNAANEKAAIIVENARNAAKMEQEINDYLAHEVRNPLAAAISACSFVKTYTDEGKPLNDQLVVESVRDDVNIIDNSLNFINDLLRTLLDMHKAASNKMTVDKVLLDLKKDVLSPVASMLYQRGAEFEVSVECPQDLFIMSDPLRLKQIILNLGRNSAKFVERGYIRLGAEIGPDSHVRIFVEDSGCGIPQEKRGSIFSKFQESLDVLSQGTGVGLCLCEKMTHVLQGEIWLDEDYDNEIEGQPGSRFVIDLKSPPVSTEEYETILSPNDSAKPPTSVSPDSSEGTCPLSENEEQSPLIEEKVVIEEDITLPEDLSILFVDDDLVLRKLFTRSVRRAAPSWKISEASNGEAAVDMVDTQEFDIIFIDQYMASVSKQMLGTETARALRKKGVTSRICGLSANDVEKGFLLAGADFFMFKPMPCAVKELKKELHNMVHSRRRPELEDEGDQQLHALGSSSPDLLVRFSTNGESDSSQA